MGKNIKVRQSDSSELKLNNIVKIRTELQSGGTCDWVPEDDVSLVMKTVTENGTYSAENDNAYGYSSVTVNVQSGYPEPTGTITIGQNGTANVKDYAAAAVNVPNTYTAEDEGKIVKNGALVPLSLQSKTATQNGTVTPDQGYDGLSSVVVDVQSGSAQCIDYSGVTFSNTATAEIGDAETGWILSKLESPSKDGTAASGDEQTICTKAPIDLTNIGTIVVLFAWLDNETNSNCYFGVSQAAPTSYTDAIGIAAKTVTISRSSSRYGSESSNKTEISTFMAVSNLTGPYYVWIATKLTYSNYGYVRNKFVLYTIPER